MSPNNCNWFLPMTALISVLLSVSTLFHREDPSSGAVEITASRSPGSEGVSGHGVVATLTFQANATGRFPVKITKAAVVQPDQQLTAASGSEITVSVQ